MPFRSFYSGAVQTMAKRTARRIAYSRAARQAAAAAYRARSRVNVARRGLMRTRGELKVIEEKINNPECVYDNTTMILMNGCARGDDISERNGRQIIIRSIQMRGEFYSKSGTGGDGVCRVDIVQDKQTNGSALTPAQYFSGAADASRPFQYVNLENRMRFRTLFSAIRAVSAPSEANTKYVVSMFKRCYIPVVFNNGDAGTVADIISNSIYLVCTGSQASLGTPCAFQGWFRIRYEDK